MIKDRFKFPIGQKIFLPSHFNFEVILEDVRKIGNNYELKGEKDCFYTLFISFFK